MTNPKSYVILFGQNEVKRSRFHRTARRVTVNNEHSGTECAEFCCGGNGIVFRLFYFLEVPDISTKDYLLNEEINVPQVRLIGEEGEQLGIVDSAKARKLAEEAGSDLVMIAPTAQPPVCRIMDYGKFRFEREKREKEAKKKQQVVEVKEIQLSCNIGEHDFNTKLGHALKFLKEGNKVRAVVKFNGRREMLHPELGTAMMDKFVEACSEFGTTEKKAVMEGRKLSLIISPVAKK